MAREYSLISLNETIFKFLQTYFWKAAGSLELFETVLLLSRTRQNLQKQNKTVNFFILLASTHNALQHVHSHQMK